MAVKRAPETPTWPPTSDMQFDVQYYRETLPEGRSYVIAEISDEHLLDNTDVFRVPAGHYFVMGDNRDNSADSRDQGSLGYVPRENFIGRFSMCFWNSDGVSLTNRPDETPVR